MKASAISLLVLCVSLSAAVEVGAQTPVGALAIDERRGDQWGWAVDYETASAAQTAALRECGAGCSRLRAGRREIFRAGGRPAVVRLGTRPQDCLKCSRMAARM